MEGSVSPMMCSSSNDGANHDYNDPDDEDKDDARMSSAVRHTRTGRPCENGCRISAPHVISRTCVRCPKAVECLLGLKNEQLFPLDFEQDDEYSPNKKMT
eukprot:1845393-Amphidinium_carterae.1